VLCAAALLSLSKYVNPPSKKTFEWNNFCTDMCEYQYL